MSNSDPLSNTSFLYDHYLGGPPGRLHQIGSYSDSSTIHPLKDPPYQSSLAASSLYNNSTDVQDQSFLVNSYSTFQNNDELINSFMQDSQACLLDDAPFDEDEFGLPNPLVSFPFYPNDESYIPLENNDVNLGMGSFQDQCIPATNTNTCMQPNLPPCNKKVHDNTISSAFLNQRPTSGCSTRAPKRKVDLSEKSELFKSAFYKIFTNRSKFPKKLVKDIHEYIRQFIPLPKMSREHIRRIDLYFDEYSAFSNIILSSLQQHKEELLDAIPELSQLK